MRHVMARKGMARFIIMIFSSIFLSKSSLEIGVGLA